MQKVQYKLLHGIWILTAALAAAGCMTAAVSAAETEQPVGWQTENNRRYYLTEDGTRAVGITEIAGVPYVFEPNGIQQTGWQTVDGKRWYYEPETGEPVFGKLRWRGEEYYISRENGKLTGLSDTEDGRILSDAQGVLQREGWHSDGNAMYYTAKDGILAAGETVIDGIPCIFDEAGVLQTGF